MYEREREEGETRAGLSHASANHLVVGGERRPEDPTRKGRRPAR